VCTVQIRSRRSRRRRRRKMGKRKRRDYLNWRKQERGQTGSGFGV